MQINEAKFLPNGKCGYVLKPSYMLGTSDYDPIYSTSLPHENQITVIVRVKCPNAC